jgi:hypothetical protein
MTIDVMRQALLWCFVINMGLLLWWSVAIMLMHDFIYRIHSKWFKMSVEKFDSIHYTGIALFKIFIFACNLVPFIALSIIR